MIEDDDRSVLRLYFKLGLEILERGTDLHAD